MTECDNLELRSELRNGGVLTPAALAALQQAMGAVGHSLSSSIQAHPSTHTELAQHNNDESGEEGDFVQEDEGDSSGQHTKHGWVATVLTDRGSRSKQPPHRNGLLAAATQLTRPRQPACGTGPMVCRQKVGKCGANCQGACTLCMRTGGVADLAITLQGHRTSLERVTHTQMSNEAASDHAGLGINSTGNQTSSCTNAETDQEPELSSVQPCRKSRPGRLFRQVQTVAPLRQLAAESGNQGADNSSTGHGGCSVLPVFGTHTSGGDRGSLSGRAAVFSGSTQVAEMPGPPIHARHAVEQPCITKHEQECWQVHEKAERHTDPFQRTAVADMPVGALSALKMALSSPGVTEGVTQVQVQHGKNVSRQSSKMVHESSSRHSTLRTAPSSGLPLRDTPSPVQHGSCDMSQLCDPQPSSSHRLSWEQKAKGPAKLSCMCGCTADEFDDVRSITAPRRRYRLVDWHNKVMPAPHLKACIANTNAAGLLGQKPCSRATDWHVSQHPGRDHQELRLQGASDHRLPFKLTEQEDSASHYTPWWKKLLTHGESRNSAIGEGASGRLLSDATSRVLDAGLAGFTSVSNQLVIWPHPQHLSMQHF